MGRTHSISYEKSATARATENVNTNNWIIEMEFCSKETRRSKFDKWAKQASKTFSYFNDCLRKSKTSMLMFKRIGKY